MRRIENYVIDFDGAVQKLRGLNASRVLLQSPLGLRRIAHEVGELLKREGFEVVFSSSNCWGGCDLPYFEAYSSNVHAIVHLGHSRFLRKEAYPTVYLECRYYDSTPLTALVEKIVSILGNMKTVGVGASVQWLDHIPVLARQLAAKGITSVTAKPDMFSAYEAQVLGCDVSALKKVEAEVEGFLVIGSVFHALGVAVSTTKSVIAADPHSQQVKNLDRHRQQILRQRYAQIEMFKKAERVGVVVSTKPGQKRLGLAKKLNHLLNMHGKNSYVVTTDEITYTAVLENRFDAFVNTACPRLSLEDQAQFPKPFLLPVESLVSLGLIEWEEVVEQGFLMYPWGWYSKTVGIKLWKSIQSLQV